MHHGLEVLAGGTVDRGVVAFHEDGERAFGKTRDVSQAPDDVRHPQRPRVVELPGLQARDLGHELFPVAGLRQRDVTHVILEIEVPVFGPVRVVE